MLRTLQNEKLERKSRLDEPGKDPDVIALQNVSMAKDETKAGRNYLRAWREFRKMTQEELGAAVGVNGSTISLLEGGHRRLSDKWLRKLAPVLNTAPGYLLDHDPEDLPTSILDIWADIPEENREMAVRVLQSFRRTGTHD
jgi:transcriptional regulator with XRE-family HTH domain